MRSGWGVSEGKDFRDEGFEPDSVRELIVMDEDGAGKVAE
jgi:hypothetical protein